MEGQFNRNGGLTLVPMPGFMRVAEQVAEKIQEIGSEPAEDRWVTPVDIASPEFDYRSSGEPFLRLGKRHVGGHDCVVIGSGPGTDQMLMRTMMLLRYLAGRRAQRIALVEGYFPLSRSDKDEGGLEFALPPFIIEMLRAAATGPDVGLSRIIAADLHAPQVVMGGTTGLIVEIPLVRRVIRRAVEDAIKLGLPIVIAFPDEGAQKRFEKVIDQIEDEFRIKIPRARGVKRRKSSTESKLMELYGDVESIRGSTVLC
ncbi:hypothetical protein EBS80_01945, partial [bacterium]|nr:hypothetical protein [bacterium]